jgi:negative regulator of sigma-B (phosphoserine phosphatase)
MTLVATGIACAPLAGQTSSGDRGLVVEFPGGALVAAIDGLGHGHEASLAAGEAELVLKDDPGAPVDELVQRCHNRLRSTRGAVMTLASVTPGTISWIGIGNVEGILVKPNGLEAVPARGGIVGYSMPALVARKVAVANGDTLVLATDGIRHGFRAEVDAREPQMIADAMLAKYGKGSDDACIVIARYIGGSA